MAEPKPTTPRPVDNEVALTAAVKEAIASLDAGRGVAYDAVRRWLLSWGTDKELPPPECP
jgi:predicted transcriptional regulator